MDGMEAFGFVMPHWAYWGWLAIMPLIMMGLDKLFSKGEPEEDNIPADIKELLEGEDPNAKYGSLGNGFTRVFDWISEHTGIFVAFWTVNAVCFYFFEVVMRYVFNEPTIWVHESSYLLLGMQYLLAGSFALLHGAHVRVDVIYNFLPPRGRVGMDIFTSMFFFIFALTLVTTSFRFFTDSYQMEEITVEAWGIQYWPVKGMMLLGSVLLLMAGISKLIKDIQLFIRMGRGEMS